MNKYKNVFIVSWSYFFLFSFAHARASCAPGLPLKNNIINTFQFDSSIYQMREADLPGYSWGGQLFSYYNITVLYCYDADQFFAISNTNHTKECIIDTGTAPNSGKPYAKVFSMKGISDCHIKLLQSSHSLFHYKIDITS